MNLYLISQDQNDDYDTYDSAVVCAESEDDAMAMHPNGSVCEWPVTGFTTWAFSQDAIVVKLIGVAGNEIPRGVVCASFNAG